MSTAARQAIGPVRNSASWPVPASPCGKALPITTEIAVLSQTHSALNHGDPADRLIAATAFHHRAALITGDSRLREVGVLDTLW